MKAKAVFVGWVLCSVATLAGAQNYVIRDLGPVAPAAINSWGQIAGNYNNHAYIYSLGRWRNLGTLSGGTFSSAAAINDLGVIAGSADGPGTVTASWNKNDHYRCPDLIQPIIWSLPHGMLGLGDTIYYNGEYGQCFFTYYSTGINIHNQIVGSNESYASYEYGFLWSRGDGETQFAGGYQTTVSAINTPGDVAGQVTDDEFDFESHAALWKNGVDTDLGTLGGTDTQCSVANSVNDFDLVVGYSATETGPWSSEACFYFDNPEDPFHAFLWTQGSGMQDLGVVPGDTYSAAQKVNYNGLVVGSSGNSPSYNSETQVWTVSGHAFLWSQHSGMQDLNTLIPGGSGWVLTSAVDINIWGQIIGQGTKDGKTHGFLLTPTNPF